VDCANVALSVFYSPVLTRCRIFLQLWTALCQDTADNIIYVLYSDTLQLSTTSKECVQNNMHRDVGEWRHGEGISHVFSKREAAGAEMLFHRRCGSRHIFEVRLCVPRIFDRIFPNLPEKMFVQLLPAIVLQQRSWRPFLVWPPKKGRRVFFCKPWAPFFEIRQRWVPFLPGFSGILPNFQQIKTFGGAHCACTPTSNITAFHNSITGNFVVYQDRLQTYLLHLFEHPESSEWFSIICYFWDQHCWQTETNVIGNDVFVFYKFLLPSTVLLLPCPTAAPASLNTHVVSTNFAKPLVSNVNMTSYCDLTNSVYLVTRTTIHRCSMLGFGRGRVASSLEKRGLSRKGSFWYHFSA